MLFKHMISFKYMNYLFNVIYLLPSASSTQAWNIYLNFNIFIKYAFASLQIAEL